MSTYTSESVTDNKCPFPHGNNDNEINNSNKNVSGNINGNEANSGGNNAELPAMSYETYLQVNKLLSCHRPRSIVFNGRMAHDEHLFIIIHQAFELWFQAILFEIDSIREIFMRKDPNDANKDLDPDENSLRVVADRLSRIVTIWNLLTQQITVIETMSPLNFMEFRGLLSPASGFQSLQFRLIENKLGLKHEKRNTCGGQPYTEQFDVNENQLLKKSTDEFTLFFLVERWLSRLPELHAKPTNFLNIYTEAMKSYLGHNRDIALAQTADEESRKRLHEDYENNMKTSFINESDYNASVQTGNRSFNYMAHQGIILISLYSEETKFYQRFRVLTLLREIDGIIMKWRFVHSGMVQKMIGSKIGTGGSSGYMYLKSTVSDKYKIFQDLFNISTYLLPKEFIPTLESWAN